MRTIDTINHHIKYQCHNLQALKRADKTLTRRKQEDADMKKTLGMARHSYRVELVDIDSSTFTDTIRAYSFEDALIRAREKFKGYEIKSVKLT